MGILIPIRIHVDKMLASAMKKPVWGASEKELRAIRWAQAVAKNFITFGRKQ